MPRVGATGMAALRGLLMDEGSKSSSLAQITCASEVQVVDAEDESRVVTSSTLPVTTRLAQEEFLLGAVRRTWIARCEALGLTDTSGLAATGSLEVWPVSGALVSEGRCANGHQAG